jgi:glutathione synthase/RimK-type ligase-like ATP-grasp enzyme
LPKRLGFKTPFTIVSNCEDWTKYLRKGTEYFTVKSIAAYHWFDEDESEYSLKSSKVHVKQLLEHSHDFTICPTLIQEYIDKKYEWRITVVQDKIFSCRLNSQIVEGAKDDWRMVEVSEIPHEIIEIDDNLKSLIFRYLREFNLQFGAFDFIETDAGEFVFLECNPNGQWLWIELITKAKISLAIADYLFRK